MGSLGKVKIGELGSTAGKPIVCKGSLSTEEEKYLLA
jgi:hypothetical protein